MLPNIILIVADSLRYDHVGPQTGGTSLTPNLDAVAKQGIVFSQAIAQGPSTRVSMSALLSSTYASLHGGEQRLSVERPVVQQMLKEAGYTTAGITSNLYLSGSFGWQRGFDHYDDCRPEAVYRRKLGLRIANQVTKRLGQPLVWPRALPANLVFENAEMFWKNINRHFFMWVHLMDTHWPYSIQKFSWSPEWRRQRRQDVSIRPRLVADQPQLSQSEITELIDQYKYSVRYTDGHIGAFLRRLEAAGLRENSWIFITADHGEEFLEHGRFFHHPTPYEELVHVPLIVLPPRSFSSRQFKTYPGQVRLIDLVPTFLELAKASPPPGTRLFGASLVPIFHGQNPTEERLAITESPHNQYLAVRSDCWKYIWNVKDDQRMLFNLNQDEGEKDNLVTREVGRADTLHSILEDHLAMTQQAGSKNGRQDEEFVVDRDVMERLRGLGYVD